MKYYAIAILCVLLNSCGGDETNIVYQFETPEEEHHATCSSIIAAERTTLVSPQINLSASAESLQKRVQQVSAQGLEAAQTQVGLTNATASRLTGASFSLPLTNDFSLSNISFDATLSGQGNNLGTVTINLDVTAGVPATVSTFNDLRILASVINAQLFSPSLPQTSIDLVASAIDLDGGNYTLEFLALEEGLASTISLSNLSTSTSQIGLSSSLISIEGIPAVSNAYGTQSIDFTDDEGNTVTYTSQADAQADDIAREINALQGISASAETNATLSDYVNAAGNMRLSLNSVELSSNNISDLSNEINQLSNTTLPGFSATYNTSSIIVTNATGGDIRIQIDSSDDGDQITLQGNPELASVTLEVDAAGDGVAGTNVDARLNTGLIGGIPTIQLDEGYSMSLNNISGLFQPLTPSDYEEVTANPFSRDNRGTFNSLVTEAIFDSLGIEHELAMYFVKHGYSVLDPMSRPNYWTVYVFVDDANVGDPDTTLPPPQNTAATLAQHDIEFYSNGNISESFINTMLISNWIPLDDSGEPNSAAGPQNVLAGGSIPLADPPTSSNFVIDFNQMTQIGDEYVAYDVEQNGSVSICSE